MPYKCCEHCVDDPVYHQDYPEDSHDSTCSTFGRPCKDGDTWIPEPSVFDPILHAWAATPAPGPPMPPRSARRAWLPAPLEDSRERGAGDQPEGDPATRPLRDQPWMDDPAWQEARAIYLDAPGEFPQDRLVARLKAIVVMCEREQAVIRDTPGNSSVLR